MEVWPLLIGLEGNKVPYVKRKPQIKPQDGESLTSPGEGGHLDLNALMILLHFCVISPETF